MTGTLKEQAGRLRGFPALLSIVLLANLLLAGAPAARAESGPALPEKVMLPGFPVYAQWYNLSCEYSAARMLTAYWKKEIGENDFISNIPFNANPHLGFRGNINGSWGGTTNYGIYAEPIARFLETRGFKTKLLVGTQDNLKRELALGRPVQVWTIAGMGRGWPFTASSEGLNFILAAGEHSAVVYGYDSGGVYLADPGFGTADYYSWGAFLRSWAYFDNMALAVWPAGDPLQDKAGSTGIDRYFYRHWLNGGGVEILGLPLEEPEVNGPQVYQYFERARLEYNLNGQAAQPVQAGLLGRELTRDRAGEAAFQPVPPGASGGGLYFAATGHTLNQGFRAFWEKNGGLAVFGLPISEEFREGALVVQYFERARLEYHAANPEPYKILPGRVGYERLKQK